MGIHMLLTRIFFMEKEVQISCVYGTFAILSINFIHEQ